MNFKILLSLFQKKLSIRIFSALFTFILLLSFIFYFSGKALILTNIRNHFYCTFSSCTNSLSVKMYGRYRCALTLYSEGGIYAFFPIAFKNRAKCLILIIAIRRVLSALKFFVSSQWSSISFVISLASG